MAGCRDDWRFNYGLGFGRLIRGGQTQRKFSRRPAADSINGRRRRRRAGALIGESRFDRVDCVYLCGGAAGPSEYPAIDGSDAICNEASRRRVARRRRPESAGSLPVVNRRGRARPISDDGGAKTNRAVSQPGRQLLRRPTCAVSSAATRPFDFPHRLVAASIKSASLAVMQNSARPLFADEPSNRSSITPSPLQAHPPGRPATIAQQQHHRRPSFPSAQLDPLLIANEARLGAKFLNPINRRPIIYRNRAPLLQLSTSEAESPLNLAGRLREQGSSSACSSPIQSPRRISNLAHHIDKG